MLSASHHGLGDKGKCLFNVCLYAVFYTGFSSVCGSMVTCDVEQNSSALNGVVGEIQVYSEQVFCTQLAFK